MTITRWKRQAKRMWRWVKKRRSIVFTLALVLIASLSYAGYMADRRLSVDPETYRPLLDLVGEAESNDNYDAHFGNAGNTKLKFTTMTIDEVLAWQAEFVSQGNPSSAVGRYQIINTTLSGLAHELNLDTSQTKFDRETQDQLAIALLERRGSIAYVNKELDKKQFAANLAKEWAALPKVVGSDPEKSYYDGDRLNASRVKVPEILAAIEPISPVKNSQS